MPLGTSPLMQRPWVRSEELLVVFLQQPSWPDPQAPARFPCAVTAGLGLPRCPLLCSPYHTPHLSKALPWLSHKNSRKCGEDIKTLGSISTSASLTSPQLAPLREGKRQTGGIKMSRDAESTCGSSHARHLRPGWALAMGSQWHCPTNTSKTIGLKSSP